MSTDERYGIHGYKYRFRFPTNEEGHISRIYFEEKVTGEIIEGKGNITRWVNELINDNDDLIKENMNLTVDNKELKCTNIDLFKSNERLQKQNKELKQELKDCTAKAKEEIRKQEEENAIRWANIGR